MKKLLIVGQNSYVGDSVCEYLGTHHTDIQVDTVDSRNSQWKKVDFSEYDAVYNVSGLCHADSKHGTPEKYMEVNAQLPVDIATKAKSEGVKLFINMSSAIVFGNMSRIGEEKFIGIDTIPKPVNIYGHSKLRAEEELLKLEDEAFGIVAIRSPLIYGEKAKDNFPRLVKFAKNFPIFPHIENAQSMIYIDNFCELIYLIVLNNARGIYMPQDEKYICTSQLVKDIAVAKGKKIWLTKLFNPVIRLMSCKVYFFNKVFGNVTYDNVGLKYFDNKYRVVDYDSAIKRIANYEEAQN